MDYQYRHKEAKQLRNWFNDKRRKDKTDFTTFTEFYNWYNNQPKQCHYCTLTEQESQELVVRGLLKSKRFPFEGVLERGKNRAMWLEVDKKDPNGKYSPTNSVLCCYFCNNDKSDVFHADAYKLFVQDRPAYLKSLLKK